MSLVSVLNYQQPNPRIMEDFLFREEDILERVDEYTLYCFYLGFNPDLGATYSSPLRKDATPSFKLFNATKIPNREIGWKDHGLGLSGDVFNLVKLLYQYRSKSQAVARVVSDFHLGPLLPNEPRLPLNPAPRCEPASILVKAKKMAEHDLRWWRQFNISRGILDFYRVQAIGCYWTRPSQHSPAFPPMGAGYWYQIGTKSKLYFPLAEKGFKFRNDLTDKELEGFAQLAYKGPLTITKSYKDVMCLRSFGFDAVAGHSETTLIPQEYLTYFEERYGKDNICMLFDNDGKHKADSYPYRKVWVPKESGEKDTTDYCKHYGIAATESLLKQLIYVY